MTSKILAQTTATHSDTLNQVTIVIWLLVAIAVVAVLTKYIRLPYTIALVIAGIVIAVAPGVQQITLTPDLITLVFLPTLLFEAAYNLNFEHLRENVRFITALAIWGVLGTAGLVAGFLILVAGLSWQTALVFGAIVGATDPVSVVATFKQLGTPRRLTIIIEGESLFNDGSSLVLFNIITGIIVAGNFNLFGSLVDFVKVAAGGLLVGVAVSYLASAVLGHINDYLTETVVTVIAAYGTFLIAELLDVSPALAVVSAGLLVGNFAQEKSMSPSTRVAVGLGWEFFGFIANSLIFLLVGLQVKVINLTSFVGVTLLGIVATLLARAIVIAFFSWLLQLFSKKRIIPISWQMMLVWGGLRGSLSLAMALSIPIVVANGTEFPDRNQLLVMTFGLIMFSLLVQGLTIEPLMRKLKLGRNVSDQIQRYETLRGRLLTIRAATQRIDEMKTRGLVTVEVAEELYRDYSVQEEVVNVELQELHLANEFLREEQLRTARRRLLLLERSTLTDLFTRGLINEEVLHELQSEIDARLMLLDESHEENETNTGSPELLAAHIVGQDEILAAQSDTEETNTKINTEEPQP